MAKKRRNRRPSIAEQSGANNRKLHPKLRMIANGSDTVNGMRAELSSTVASLSKVASVKFDALPRRAQLDLRRPDELRAPGNESVLAEVTGFAKRKKLKSAGLPRNSFVNVFIELNRDRPGSKPSDVREQIDDLKKQIKGKLKGEPARELDNNVELKRNFIAATVPVTMLEQLKNNDWVSFVHPAEPLTFRLPMPHRLSGSMRPASRRVSRAADHGDGEGVMIGIIDVEGFDFAHPDFLDRQGKTRFVSIWDQGSTTYSVPNGFNYGSELTQRHMNAAIAAAKKPGGLPATMLEAQSQQQEGSHGTHVASIAAGNSGVCPKAEIAAVLISMPRQRDPLKERRLTFSDSTRIAHAVDYLLKQAQDKKKPISINISLGTNGGAHDGSSGVSRWLDAALASEGRSICVAAGNAGQEAATGPNDMGWVTGRIHSSGQIQARGLDVDLDWTVVGNSVVDVSENELEIWYGAQDRFSVKVQPPDSDRWIEVKPREFVENRRLPSGTMLSVYNELYHPTNGCNYIAIYLSPHLDPAKPKGVQAGVWKIRLHGEEIRDGRFHCWIERDDPYELDRLGQLRVYRFPSFFSERSNVDSHSISSLACGHRVIAVANVDTEKQRINPTSSEGPTRDNRYKPDIAAPGTDIVAAKGFSSAETPWTAMTGTSMASPYVAGVVGLMLAANGKLTSAQCSGILQRTCRPLPGQSFEWRKDMGFGQIDPEAAIAEARTFNLRVDRT